MVRCRKRKAAFAPIIAVPMLTNAVRDCMIKRAPTWCTALVAIALAAPVSAAASRSALDRDLESYAVASCMIATQIPSLVEQGQGWAGALVERSHGPIEEFHLIATVVEEEIRVSGFAVGHRDAPVASGSVMLHMLTCGEIIDAPRVARAIGRARTALAHAYRRAR